MSSHASAPVTTSLLTILCVALVHRDRPDWLAIGVGDAARAAALSPERVSLWSLSRTPSASVPSHAPTILAPGASRALKQMWSIGPWLSNPSGTRSVSVRQPGRRPRAVRGASPGPRGHPARVAGPFVERIGLTAMVVVCGRAKARGFPSDRQPRRRGSTRGSGFGGEEYGARRQVAHRARGRRASVQRRSPRAHPGVLGLADRARPTDSRATTRAPHASAGLRAG